MFQGIVLLVMAVGIAGLGVYALGNTDEVCRRRAGARGQVVRGTAIAPSAGERLKVRVLGVVSIVLGVVVAVFAIVVMGKISDLESEQRDLEQRTRSLDETRSFAADVPELSSGLTNTP